MKSVLNFLGFTSLGLLLVIVVGFILLSFVKGCCWVQQWTFFYDEDHASHHEDCVNKQTVYTVVLREMEGYKYPRNVEYLCYELRNLDGENCVNVGGVNFYKGIVARMFPSGNLVYFNPDDVVSVTKNEYFVKCNENHKHFFQWIID